MVAHELSISLPPLPPHDINSSSGNLHDVHGYHRLDAIIAIATLPAIAQR